MFIKNFLLILIFIAVPNIVLGQVSNLDEIYREIVKTENQTYLPMFVKNRQTPNFLKDIEANEAKESQAQQEIIELQNQRKIQEEKKKAEDLKWQAVILSVKQNKVTPLDLEEVEKKASQNNPEAVEIFAFMNAKGQGIEQNLIKSFLLYQKATGLGINNAKANAILVYKSMSFEQKEALKTAQPL